jgi:Ulp1 protease family, C-terminal catalytic domain
VNPSVLKRPSRRVSNCRPQELRVGEKLDTYDSKYKDCTNAKLQLFKRDLSCDRYLMRELIERYPQLSTPHQQPKKVGRVPQEKGKKASPAVETDDLDIIQVSDDDSEVIEDTSVVAGGVSMLTKDFDCLIKNSSVAGDLYLGGEIISSYTNLMMNEVAKMGGKMFHFDCMLLSCTLKYKTTYSNLLQEKKAVSCPVWSMPAHVGEEEFKHWLLYIVDWKSETITCLDILQNHDIESVGCRKYLPALRLLLNTAHQSRHHTPLKSDEWQVFLPEDTNTQMNDFDCGLFVCYWVELVCRGQSAYQLPRKLIGSLFRKRINNRILAGKGEVVRPPCVYSTIAPSHVERTCSFSRRSFKNVRKGEVPEGWKTTEDYLMSLGERSKS